MAMPDVKTAIVLGIGPLPIGNPERTYAPGLRLFAFCQTLLQAGFRVFTGEATFGEEASVTLTSNTPKVETLAENWERANLPMHQARAGEILSSWIERENPIALISTTDVMNRLLAGIDTPVPKWMDFNGHPMVERQELSYIHQSDEGLLDQWVFVVPALLCGDHFSVCSNPQRHAMIGELGAVGRLNRLTSGHELVSVLPPGAVFHEPEPDGRPAFRGEIAPEDAFCLLWSGGFNTWVDEKTLFEGVSLAMEKSERIHFILTGGEIKGHDELTFPRFKKRVEACKFKDRFHFVGWAPLADLPNYYTEADAAVNIDRFTYEAVLGMRNRILSWMNFELPVITTAVSEFTMMLAARGLAASFPPGDATALADILLRMEQDANFFKQMAARAKKFLLMEYRFDQLLHPLVDWLERPCIAPDRVKENLYVHQSLELGTLAVPDNTLARCHLDALGTAGNLKKLRQVQSELRAIKSSRSYKWAQRIKRIIGR